MRSLVPALSFVLLSFSCSGLSRPSQKPPNVNSTIASVPCNLDKGSGQNLRSYNQKLCKQIKQEVAHANSNMLGVPKSNRTCATLKTYAPRTQKGLPRSGALVKPYYRQTFTLQSTCSFGGQLQALSLKTSVDPKN